MRASSSSEVDDTTRDWRRGGNTGGRTHSGLGGPSESCGGLGGKSGVKKAKIGNTCDICRRKLTLYCEYQIKQKRT